MQLCWTEPRAQIRRVQIQRSSDTAKFRSRRRATLSEATGTYNIDPAHSRIGFIARHAMVTKVRGSFNEFSGSGFFDPEDPSNSHLELIIEASSIDTRNADRDAHLRSNDFFAMAEFPQISFVSTAVEHL